MMIGSTVAGRQNAYHCISDEVKLCAGVNKELSKSVDYIYSYITIATCTVATQAGSIAHCMCPFRIYSAIYTYVTSYGYSLQMHRLCTRIL